MGVGAKDAVGEDWDAGMEGTYIFDDDDVVYIVLVDLNGSNLMLFVLSENFECHIFSEEQSLYTVFID